MFLLLHSSELQHSFAHTKFPGSFQECCFNIACSLCHKHKHEHGMFALALAAPSPLGIQETENAMWGENHPHPEHKQTQTSHESPVLVPYTLGMCFLFISLMGASPGTEADLAHFL